MYGKYVTTSSWTVADLINDMFLLVTGNPISALSASCNKASSTQAGTTHLGASCTQYDIADGSAIAGQVWDIVTNGDHHYLRINCTATTSIGWSLSTGWNPSTNAATNATARPVLTVTAGVANTIYYWVSGSSFQFQFGNNFLPGYYEIQMHSPAAGWASGQMQAVIPNSTAPQFNSYRRHPYTGTIGASAEFLLGQPRGVSLTAASSGNNLLGGFYAADGTRFFSFEPAYLCFYASASTTHQLTLAKLHDDVWFFGGQGAMGDIVVDGNTSDEYMLLGVSAGYKLMYPLI